MRRKISNVVAMYLREKRISLEKLTYNGYSSRVNTFLYWCLEYGPGDVNINRIGENNMATFFGWLSNIRDADKATAQKYLMILKQIWRYAGKIGVCNKMPFTRVVLPPKKVDYSSLIMSKADRITLERAMKARDKQLYLCCMLQYYCFIRPGNEMTALKRSDFNLKKGQESVMIRQAGSKNKRNEVITIPEPLINILKEYEFNKIPDDHYIFSRRRTHGTKRLHPNTMRIRFINLRKDLGLDTKIKLYSFKHTGASELHRSGVPLVDMMEQLRHVSMKSTQHYVKKHVGTINPRLRKWFINTK